MRGASSDDERPVAAGHASPRAPRPDASEQVTALFREARQGSPSDAAGVLARLEPLIADLEADADPEPFLQALHARTWILHRSGARLEACLEAADDLRSAAAARRLDVWTALGHAQRGLIRVEAGQAGAALTDLAEADDHVPLASAGGTATSTGCRPAPFLLLDTLARAYARLRLVERSGFLREEATRLPVRHRPDDEAEFRAAWAADLAVQALEPLAMGTGTPDPAVLSRAEQVGAALGRLPADVVGERLGRGQDAVRALAAAYHGQPTAALRLLGRNAFGEARDLPALQRQIATLAAMKAHVLVGSLASARSLDEAASSTPSPTVHVVLDICRARERVWLESHAGGDVTPVLHRLATLLVQLSWQALDLVGDTARQALEQHATREESRTDALTGVGNRRALDEELRHLLRFGELPLSLVLVDVDHFKQVNDAFTHVVGDEVLRRVAAALSGQLRTGDRLLRYGGDEFVVLLPETGDAEAHHVARRMADAVADVDWAALEDGLRVSVTSGCAAVWSLTGRRPDADAERLFRRADEALLEAKRRRSPADDAAADLAVGAGASRTQIPSARTPDAERTQAREAPPAAVREPSHAETTGWTLTPATGHGHVRDVPTTPSDADGHGEPASTPPRRRQRHAAPEPPPTTIIDVRDLPRRRERLRPRPPGRAAAGAFEDPVPED